MLNITTILTHVFELVVYGMEISILL